MKIKGLVFHATPRTLLFYFAVLVLLLSVVISELGFALNNPILFIAGTIVLVLWFVIIFIAVLPETNIALVKHTNQTEAGSTYYICLALIIGLSEASLIII